LPCSLGSIGGHFIGRAALDTSSPTLPNIFIIVACSSAGRPSWLESFPQLLTDPARAAQAARIMNDEFAAVIATAPDRFRGVAILRTLDPDAAVTELHRAVRELRFVGALLVVRPTIKRLDHPDFEILFKALVELDATLSLHPSRPPTLPNYLNETSSNGRESDGFHGASMYLGR